MDSLDKNKTPDSAHVKLDAPVIQLLQEYFANRKEIKNIKRQRIEYMETHKCEGEDCIRDGTLKDDYCDICKQRNEFHKNILKLVHRNNGIMNKVRAKVV